MIERPIIFSGPMVQAILADRKTQTRRVIKYPSTGAFVVVQGYWTDDSDGWWPQVSADGESMLDSHGNETPMSCPYGNPGDRLWVKDTCYIWGRWYKNGTTTSGRQKWRFNADTPHTAIFDPSHPQVARKSTSRQTRMYWRRNSIFMPRWASRLTLEITDVRVQRLQDIQHADVEAEGIWNPPNMMHWEGSPLTKHGTKPGDPVEAFSLLWDKLNAKRGHGWETNPWVWALSFKRVRP